jgi:hypothetical protein
MGILDTVGGFFKKGSVNVPTYGAEDPYEVDGSAEAMGNAPVSGGRLPGVIDSALNMFDPSNVRRSISGLLTGGAASRGTTVVGFNRSSSAGDTDWRVRISLANRASYFYNSSNKGVMAPLFNGTGQSGVIFPYSPQIQVQHTARYGNQKLTHSNYDAYFYEGSEVQAITISGEFTAQNDLEAKYVLASIYFFRACTKMWFGQGELAGNPPPLVYLDGYGDHYFPHVTCVITNFSHTMPGDSDYIETYIGQESTRIPTSSTISVTLQPVVSRNKARGFDLDEFARGNLLNGRGGFL